MTEEEQEQFEECINDASEIYELAESMLKDLSCLTSVEEWDDFGPNISEAWMKAGDIVKQLKQLEKKVAKCQKAKRE